MSRPLATEGEEFDWARELREGCEQRLMLAATEYERHPIAASG